MEKVSLVKLGTKLASVFSPMHSLFYFYFFGFALITHISICHTSQMHSECTNQTILSMNDYYLYSTFTWRVLASSWEGEYSVFVLL